MNRSNFGFLVVFVAMLCFFPSPVLADEGSAVKWDPKFLWSVSMKTGYQYMDMSFNAPFDAGPLGAALAHPSPLNLKLHNADLWVIGVGANAKKGRFFGFMEAEANTPRHTEITSSPNPFLAGLSPVEWNNCKLEWWTVNGGVGMDITPNFAIEAGLKVEKLSLGLKAPVDDIGVIPLWQQAFGDSYQGNLDSKLLLPWIGVRAQISRFNGSLRFSPYAHTDVEIPTTYNYVLSPTVTYVEEENYNFRNDGIWLETSLAYDIFKSEKWTCSLWGEASWLWTDGRTTNTYRATLHQSGSSPTTIITDSSTKESEYEIGKYGVGLSIVYSF